MNYRTLLRQQPAGNFTITETMQDGVLYLTVDDPVTADWLWRSGESRRRKGLWRAVRVEIRIRNSCYLDGVAESLAELRSRSRDQPSPVN